MKNYPFLLVTPWSETTFKVLADDIGNTECSRTQLRAVLEAWIAKHLSEQNPPQFSGGTSAATGSSAANSID